MEKVSETGIEKFREKIGTDGLIMNIRVQKTADGTSFNAPVVRGEKKVATLSSETDGSFMLSAEKDANLSPAEFFDLFKKSADVLAEINGVEKPE